MKEADAILPELRIRSNSGKLYFPSKPEGKA
jgi:hypothetical protein